MNYSLLTVSDAQAILELWLNANLLQPNVDLGTSTMHQNAPNAHGGQENNVGNHTSLTGGIDKAFKSSLMSTRICRMGGYPTVKLLRPSAYRNTHLKRGVLHCSSACIDGQQLYYEPLPEHWRMNISSQEVHQQIVTEPTIFDNNRFACKLSQER